MLRSLRPVAITYLAFEAVAMIAWWSWLLASADARQRFAPAGSQNALLAFCGADLLLLAGGSIVAVIGILRRAPWTGPALCVHAGAVAYAACWAFALGALEPARLSGVYLMAPLLAMAVALPLWWNLQARA